VIIRGDEMKLRKATILDLDEITEIEAKCFPQEEAATKQSFQERLTYYPECFWVLEVNHKIVSFVDGMKSNEALIKDEMFEDASLHQSDGKWQMIFGVNTLPEYRRKGYAGLLIRQVIHDAKRQDCKGVVLTCKKEKINYYAKFGFINEGISQSIHGGAIWYDMRITFNKENGCNG
jgi:ribosomal protein S18 acetylase RimI-like enzyme